MTRTHGQHPQVAPQLNYGVCGQHPFLLASYLLVSFSNTHLSSAARISVRKVDWSVMQKGLLLGASIRWLVAPSPLSHSTLKLVCLGFSD